MAFIKAQKIIRDDSGNVISGSAAVVDAVYVKTGGKSHSRQEVREKLGRVLYLSEDRKVGVFQSPTAVRRRFHGNISGRQGSTMVCAGLWIYG